MANFTSPATAAQLRSKVPNRTAFSGPVAGGMITYSLGYTGNEADADANHFAVEIPWDWRIQAIVYRMGASTTGTMEVSWATGHTGKAPAGESAIITTLDFSSDPLTGIITAETTPALLSGQRSPKDAGVGMESSPPYLLIKLINTINYATVTVYMNTVRHLTSNREDD